MPWAEGKPLRHDALLTNIAVRAFATGSNQFIADKIFPLAPVAERSDRYPIIKKDAFFRVMDLVRAPRGRANRISFDVSSDSYFCENYALAADYPVEDLTNAAVSFQIRENHTKLVTDVLMRGQEVRIANIISSGSNSGGTVALSGSQQWSVVASADILAQVSSAHATIRMATGLLPNTCVVDYDSLQLARRNTRLLELFNYTRAGELPDDVLRTQIFKVDKLLVGNGVKNTAPAGVTASMANIWGDICWFGHTTPTAGGLETMTYGLRMEWRPAGFAAPMAVIRDQYMGAGENKIEVLEAMHWGAEKVIAPELGYCITDTIA